MDPSVAYGKSDHAKAAPRKQRYAALRQEIGREAGRGVAG